MKRIITYKITEEYNSFSVEQFLKSKNYPHGVFVTLKKTENGILLNNEWAYVRSKLKTNDILTITLLEKDNSSNITPIPGTLDIIYEDEDVIIINKPFQMPVHPSMGHHENTLANHLMDYYATDEDGFVFRCINRLDRDTTGLTLIAKNALSAGILSRQVGHKLVKRTYLAICEGEVDNCGTINLPIGRVEGSTIERQVDLEHGEVAITHFKKIAYQKDNDLSLVELTLETGRTHQIRVHMKAIGHPLIGDFLYNSECKKMERQALHSYSLSFCHPITNESMHFSSPLPSDMKRFFPCI